MRVFLVIVLTIVLACPAATGRDEGLLSIGNERAMTGVVVELGMEGGRASDVDSSAMLRVLSGRIAILGSRELGALSKCVTTRGLAIERIMEPREVLDIVLIGKTRNKRVRLMEGSDGLVYLSVIEGDGAAAGKSEEASRKPSAAYKVDREALRDVAREQGWDWPRYSWRLSGGTKEAESAGETYEIPPPMWPGRWTVDKVLLSKRILGGRSTELRRSDRILNQEKFFCRLPKRYDAKRPAGVVVWVDAGDSGKAPSEMHAALDELNLIAVGASQSGNPRHVSDRFQLAFDALASVKARHSVDGERVYLSGISGGARVASILQGCFPEEFAGVAAVVGLSSFETVSGPDGRMYPPNYAKPSPERMNQLRERRIGAASGPKDFNFLLMQSMVMQMKAQGLEARLFEYADMGHQMATVERFAEMMRWVDEPARKRREAREARSVAMLGNYRRVWGKRAVPPAGTSSNLGSQRGDLIAITVECPWTSGAWEAADLLGVWPVERSEGDSR